MAKVRVRPETGTLYLDFSYRGVRCREQTALPETAENRRQVERLLQRIQREIAQGTFIYAATFPGSSRASQFAAPIGTTPVLRAALAPASEGHTPSFESFAKQWFAESEPQWRRSYRSSVLDIVERELIPVFKSVPVAAISKADVLSFRADLAKRPVATGTLSPARINKVVGVLRQILMEASERFQFQPAFRGIKQLKVPKSDVMPFNLDEVSLLVDTIRPDYRDYLITRFFTGMRSGEINGLKWRYVDSRSKLIQVRETIVAGKVEKGAKTDGSIRDIYMVPSVRDAIERQRALRRPGVDWVFATRDGNPIDTKNFAKRVWHPLLRHLGLEKRRPYQTRHTCATLMLASGENPEWYVFHAKAATDSTASLPPIPDESCHPFHGKPATLAG